MLQEPSLGHLHREYITGIFFVKRKKEKNSDRSFEKIKKLRNLFHLRGRGRSHKVRHGSFSKLILKVGYKLLPAIFYRRPAAV